MMKRELFILILFLQTVVLFGSNDSLIIKGNLAYNEGLYNDAVESYEKVIGSGYESAELYYNLGNSLFKLNDMPAAILYYEKARKIAPKNEDINYNLSLANSRIIDKIEAVPEFFLKQWWNQLKELFSVDTWAVSGITAFVISLLMALVFFLSGSIFLRKGTFWTGIFMLLITVISFTIAIQKYNQYTQHNEAIVFTPTVTVKSSPSEGSVDLFVIHEGTKVKISDHVEGWSEIRIADGSVGWVRNTAFKTI